MFRACETRAIASGTVEQTEAGSAPAADATRPPAPLAASLAPAVAAAPALAVGRAGALDAGALRALQRSAGNRSVARMLSGPSARLLAARPAEPDPGRHGEAAVALAQAAAARVARCPGRRCGGACECEDCDEKARAARMVAPAGRRAVQRVTFNPGVMHDHKPSGRWADVQANPNSGWKEELVCSNMSPAGVVGAAIWSEFDDKPLALAHLNWYLSTGLGKDFVEDSHLEKMLKTDAGVQRAVRRLVPTSPPAGGKFTGHLKIEQSDYVDQDFRFAFGAIDRLDVEADYGAGTLHAWFQDRYEWHPVYPFYPSKPGDVARETNCIHAALVELKAGGVAADFWMKGEATVPLSVLPASGGGGGGGAL